MTELRADLALISDWIKPESRVLDLGCGNGTLLRHLQESKGVSGYGLEIEISKVIACIHAGVNVIHADLDEGLSRFRDNSFDYVILSQTLQAVRRPDRLLREMLRCGHEGIVAFPNFGYWACRLQLAAGRMPVSKTLPHSWYDTPNIHLCTVRDFEALCRREAITVEQRLRMDHHLRARPGMGLLPNLMTDIALYRVSR
ncbi:MAG: methionine biosynthesis protein MetW [Gammaproteobacteria bacterium]|nr:methionine biosynthesis protein MetW [Gammaproteobacteria bacterium]